MSKMKLRQVFDGCGMPHEFNGEEVSILIAGPDGANNGVCYDWFPSWADIDVEYPHFKTEQEQKAAKLFNEWLVENGMIWDKEDELFSVLVDLSW